jgi:anti-sigma28 factor (negative regulator of flagellin synthesis)
MKALTDGVDGKMTNKAEKSSKPADVRATLVDKFRKQIKNESYEVKSGEIASRLAQELFAANTTIKGPGK